MTSVRHRSQRFALRALACAAAALLPSSAWAQSAAGWAVDRYEPSPAGDVFFAAPFPWYGAPGQGFALRGGLTFDYARSPIVARDAGGNSDRAIPVPLPGGTVQFSALPAGLDYVVRAAALGRDGLELASACGGPARVSPEGTARVVAQFQDAPLRLAARYTAGLTFDLTAAATAAPLEIPTRMPSSRETRRAQCMASSEVMRAISPSEPSRRPARKSRSNSPGTKPAPMPAILCGPGSPPESTGLSAGSTAT